MTGPEKADGRLGPQIKPGLHGSTPEEIEETRRRVQFFWDNMDRAYQSMASDLDCHPRYVDKLARNLGFRKARGGRHSKLLRAPCIDCLVSRPVEDLTEDHRCAKGGCARHQPPPPPAPPPKLSNGKTIDLEYERRESRKRQLKRRLGIRPPLTPDIRF